MDVRGIPGDEHPAHAQLRDLPVVDAEVAAPVQRARLDVAGRPLTHDLLHQVQRRSITLRLLDRRDDASSRRAHGKYGQGTMFARAQLELVCRKGLVRLDVSEQEQRVVFGTFEWELEE